MSAAPRLTCARCPHPLKWHRSHDGDCLHDGCACGRFTPAARRKYVRQPKIPADLMDRCCAVCRTSQHSRCTGRRNASGRGGASPRVPCECPCRRKPEATP